MNKYQERIAELESQVEDLKGEVEDAENETNEMRHMVEGMASSISDAAGSAREELEKLDLDGDDGITVDDALDYARKAENIADELYRDV